MPKTRIIVTVPTSNKMGCYQLAQDGIETLFQYILGAKREHPHKLVFWGYREIEDGLKNTSKIFENDEIFEIIGIDLNKDRLILSCEVDDSTLAGKVFDYIHRQQGSKQFETSFSPDKIFFMYPKNIIEDVSQKIQSGAITQISVDYCDKGLWKQMGKNKYQLMGEGELI